VKTTLILTTVVLAVVALFYALSNVKAGTHSKRNELLKNTCIECQAKTGYSLNKFNGQFEGTETQKQQYKECMKKSYRFN